MAGRTLSPEASRALRTVYREVFLFAGRLYDGKTAGAEANAAKHARDLLSTSRQQLLDARVPENYIKEVSLAVTFLLDEAAMSSPLAASWEELQAIEAQRRVGGDEFFERLKLLHSDPLTPVEVLEVFARCLDWGFVGPYRATDRKKALADIRESLDHTITRQLTELPPLSLRLTKSSGLPPQQPILAPRVVLVMAVVLVLLCSSGGAATIWWSARKTAEQIQAAPVTRRL